MSGHGDLDPAELIAHARAGDRRAFESLVDEDLAWVLEEARRSVRDPSRAFDIAAAALIRAWADLPSLRRTADVRRWLGGIVRDEARSNRAARTGATDLRHVRHVVVVGIASTAQRGRWRVLVADHLPARPSVRVSRPGFSRRGFALLAVVIGAVAIVTVGALGTGGSATTAVRAPSAAPSVTAAPSQSPSPLPTPVATSDMLAYAVNGDIWVAPLDGGRPTRVAHLEGLRFSQPSWSPGGDRLLFMSDEPAVFVEDLATAQLRRIVAAGHGTWSPDGASIVVGDPLRIVDLNTRLSRRLNPPQGVWFIGETESWSPNGEWIAVVGVQSDPGSNQIPRPALYRVSVRTGSVRQLAQVNGCGGHRPEWSHNSFFLAVESATDMAGPLVEIHGGPACRSGAPYAITIVDTNGSQPKLIAVGDERPMRPHWSPDDRTIAFTTLSDAGGYDMHTATFAGDDVHVLLTGVGPDVAWAPDGTRLIYVRQPEDGASGPLFNVDLAGDSRRLAGQAEASFGAVVAKRIPSSLTVAPAEDIPLAGQPLLRTAAPAGGPPAAPEARWQGLAVPDIASSCGSDRLSWDGTRTHLVVPEDLPINSNCSTNIWAVDGSRLLTVVDGAAYTRAPAGSWLRVAVGDPAFVNAASWSPLGDRIALQVCDLGSTCETPRTVLVPPDGKVLQSFVGLATWSNDERHVAVSRPDGTLFIGQADGTRLVNIGTFPQPSGWSPDGTRFLYVRDGQGWTARIDGTNVRRVTDFPYGGATAASWSPDGDWIAVRQGSSAEWVFDIAASRAWFLSGVLAFADAWAPVGHQLAVTGSAGAGPSVILVRDVNGSTVAVELPDAYAALWSGDGRWIAITGDSPSGRMSVGVANADGSGRQFIATIDSGAPLAWLPRG